LLYKELILRDKDIEINYQLVSMPLYNVALHFSESCIGTTIAILIVLLPPEPKQAKNND
jgi:hypothetical protein